VVADQVDDVDIDCKRRLLHASVDLINSAAVMAAAVLVEVRCTAILGLRVRINCFCQPSLVRLFAPMNASQVLLA